jgi:Domain of unknown function (DUF4388)/DnaJ domain
MDIPQVGNLRDHSLAKVLMFLNKKRATGTLSVSTKSFQKNIYLSDGTAIFASSSLEDDRLGEMLVRAGKITSRAYDRSVELLKETGKRQGAILVELGYISPKELFLGVKYQIKEIIYSLFELDEGTYEFYADILPIDEIITLRISIDNLIYQGVKQMRNIAAIEREMPGPDAVFRHNREYVHALKGEEGSVNLSEEDRKIYALIDGQRNLTHIVEESGADTHEVMKTLYVFDILGVIVEEESEKVYETAVEEETTEPVADMELKKKIDAFYERIHDMGPDEILQVNERSDAQEVKRNYYRIVKEYHPDRTFRIAGKDLQDRMSAIFEAVTNAYKLLQDDAKREEYFHGLERRYREKIEDARYEDQGGEKVRPGINLEEQMNRGISEFKQGNFWGAAEIFRRLTRENPKNPAYWINLSFSLGKIPKRLKEAEEAVLEAMRLEPMNSEYYAHLGIIYLTAGLKKRAKVQFDRALKIDPTNETAQKGLEKVK